MLILFIRCIQTVIAAYFKPKLRAMNEETRNTFRVTPLDIDIYRHMNHARYLNYLEACRWAYMLRSGFLGLAHHEGWIAPVAAVSIEYYRPLTLFKKFSITTRFVKVDEKWCYLLQQVYSNEKEIARALIRCTVRKGRENQPPSRYLTPLGFSPEEISAPPELESWIDQRLFSL